MAWRCSGTTNAELVANLFSAGLVTDPLVRDALARVDRAHYAPAAPYADAPQPIGHGATISAPHMHATALEHLAAFLRPASAAGGPPDDHDDAPRRALDIGSGSGYLTHAMAELALLPPEKSILPASSADPSPGVGGGGGGGVVVVGVEHVPQLAQLGEANMARSPRGRELLDSGRVRFRVGDGRNGWIEDGAGGPRERYDAIHVGAAAREVHPALLEQLKAPGRMFIPLDDADGAGGQHVWAIDKDKDGTVTRRRLFGVMYVPLTDASYYVED
jgi:protein-L-isoaspartate(D-aspartate) O-methyltransferase